MTTKELKAMILLNWIDSTTKHPDILAALRKEALIYTEASEDEIAMHNAKLQQPKPELLTWQSDH